MLRESLVLVSTFGVNKMSSVGVLNVGWITEIYLCCQVK
jgi:hypothetical protein